MKLRIWSGGQAGADQGALRAAKAAGIPTGGYVPRGWMTEDGPNLSLAEYGLVELSIRDYPTRTKACVLDADAVLWFGNKESPGGKLSLRLAREASIDSYVVIPENTPREVAGWLAGLVPANESVTLMVAGSRESRAPGIGAKVEGFMAEVFRLLAEEEA